MHTQPTTAESEDCTALAEILKTLSILELDRKLENEGGIAMPENRRLIFYNEYNRRGVPLPQ